MRVKSGHENQEHLRGLCGYIGTKKRGKYYEEILEETLAYLPSVKCDTTTLETLLSARSLELLQRADLVFGPDLFTIPRIENSDIWNVVSYVDLDPVVRHWFVERVLSSVVHTARGIRALAAKACNTENPELLSYLLSHPIVVADHSQSLEIVSGAISLKQAYDLEMSNVIAGLLGSFSPSEDEKLELTLRHHDRISAKPLAVLVKAGWATHLPAKDRSSSCSDVKEYLLDKMMSAHGRISILSELPDIVDLISMDVSDVETLLKTLAYPR